MKRSFRAFTLIELLTVLAIVAILAALAFPVFSQAREKSRGANCQSNLKQLGAAIALYTQDYDNKYPFALDARTHGSRLRFLYEEPYLRLAQKMPDLRDVLRPYVRSQNVYRCPSERQLPGDTEARWRSEWDTYGSSYSFYDYAAMLGRGDDYFERPAASYLMADSDYWHGGEDYRDGRLNELFADYHVKNVTWQGYLDSIAPPPPMP